MAVSAVPFATSRLLSEDAPFPIAATLADPSGVWEVTFDRPLQPGALDAGNWVFRANNLAWAANTGTAVGSRVMGTSTSGGIDVGADVVSFSPPPFDVLSMTAVPAAAFADFPLVVT